MNSCKILSLLLQYPDASLLSTTDELREATAALPRGPQRKAIERFLDDYFLVTSPSVLCEQYVATFDFNKRATLYLSFHGFGDKRERGMAMLNLKKRYKAAGMPLNTGELPDYLPVVLEFVACAQAEYGAEVLTDFREPLELVRAALAHEKSPYAGLLDAVCNGLPRLTDAQMREIERIAAEGPPTEMVGLEPFGADPLPAAPLVEPVLVGANVPDGGA